MMTSKKPPLLALVAVLTVLSSSSRAETTTTPTTTTTKLQGVDPAVYLQKRNHKPDVTRELRRLPVSVSLAVLNDPSAFVSGDAAYPVDLKPDAIAHLHAIEVRALVQGALTSLAERKEPRAFELLQQHLTHADVAVAAVAAERLGEIDDHRAVPTLAGLVQDESVQLNVRAGACAGLGRQRSQAALEALLPALSSSNKDEIRIAALRALGSLSSRWAWEARNDKATGDLLRARALPAVEAVKGDDAVVAVRDEMLKLLR